MSVRDRPGKSFGIFGASVTKCAGDTPGAGVLPQAKEGAFADLRDVGASLRRPAAARAGGSALSGVLCLRAVPRIEKAGKRSVIFCLYSFYRHDAWQVNCSCRVSGSFPAN